MGEYTAFKKFYKPFRPEFVNVELHWNYNLDIMDDQAFSVFNTVYTDTPDLEATDIPKQAGYHWYKTWSNSVWFANEVPDPVQQAGARVHDWSIFTGFLPNWRSPVRPDRDARLRYRVLPGGNVQWVGEIEKVDGGIIGYKAAELFGVAPVEARTTNFTREACVLGGIEGNNLSCGMFTTFANGNMVIGMMGNSNPPTDTRYISMVGVQYAIS